MKHRPPIFLWIFPELLQDNRWGGTLLAHLPLELIVKIFQYKWLFERKETKRELLDHFLYLSTSLSTNTRLMRLRTCHTFNFHWDTPNNVNIRYVLKWGPGFLSRDVKFHKTLRVASEYTEYEEVPPESLYSRIRSLIPRVNSFGLPVVAPTSRYNQLGLG
jgi:hypothetical protein